MCALNKYISYVTMLILLHHSKKVLFNEVTLTNSTLENQFKSFIANYLRFTNYIVSRKDINIMVKLLVPGILNILWFVKFVITDVNVKYASLLFPNSSFLYFLVKHKISKILFCTNKRTFILAVVFSSNNSFCIYIVFKGWSW